MRRILLLATAMLLMPVAALASSTEPDRAKTRPTIAPCTPYNPCAVAPPALAELPPSPRLERQARDERAAPQSR